MKYFLFLQYGYSRFLFQKQEQRGETLPQTEVPENIQQETEKKLQELNLEMEDQNKFLSVLKSFRISTMSEFHNRLVMLDKIFSIDLKGKIPSGKFAEYVNQDVQYKNELRDFLQNGRNYPFNKLKNFYEKSIIKLENFIKWGEGSLKEEEQKQKGKELYGKEKVVEIKNGMNAIFNKVHITTAEALTSKLPFTDSLSMVIEKKMRNAQKDINETVKKITDMRVEMESGKTELDSETANIILNIYWKFRGMRDADPKKDWKGLEGEMTKYLTPQEIKSQEIQTLLKMFSNVINDLTIILQKSGKGDLIK